MAKDREKSATSPSIRLGVWVKGYVINSNKEVQRKSYYINRLELRYFSKERLL